MADVEKKADTTVTSPPSPDIGPGTMKKRNKFLNAVKGHARDPNEYGKQLFEQALEYDEAQLERDALKVKRKIDFMILPLMCGTYSAYPQTASINPLTYNPSGLVPRQTNPKLQ